jgi:hypothetical protein
VQREKSNQKSYLLLVVLEEVGVNKVFFSPQAVRRKYRSFILSAGISKKRLSFS